MNDRTERKYPQVSDVHSRAIWNEIGERLHPTSMQKPAPMSPHLLRLVGELDGLDVGAAPSGLN
jgi:hypothetical protein